MPLTTSRILAINGIVTLLGVYGAFVPPSGPNSHFCLSGKRPDVCLPTSLPSNAITSLRKSTPVCFKIRREITISYLDTSLCLSSSVDLESIDDIRIVNREQNPSTKPSHVAYLNHTSTSDQRQEDKTITNNTDITVGMGQERRTNDKIGWMGRAKELYHFYLQHGHTRVPKRYKENPALGNWVNKQRQQYRNYRFGRKPCSMTEQRIGILDQIGFCWDASSPGSLIEPVGRFDSNHISSASTQQAEEVSDLEEQNWWSTYEELCTSGYDKADDVPSQSPLGNWLRTQRKYFAADQLDPHSMLEGRNDSDCQKLQALKQFDPDWWMTKRQYLWERRYRELKDYKSKHGDCCVPISYENRQLAHWVSTQRKQYNLRRQGESSDMTDTRQARLDAIGFVWNRWEYEFSKKEFHLD